MRRRQGIDVVDSHHIAGARKRLSHESVELPSAFEAFKVFQSFETFRQIRSIIVGKDDRGG